MRNTIQEERLEDKLEGDDKGRAEKTAQDTLDWLDTNLRAE
eukprot:CAMPEP_0179052292 /NCGR_PEP_ID=MMETSP0796-20121207/21683_1 /TAXON_ID=73915 /ORGANISM="Pyrodinium bahamense, Strain pbaha01" /LENGTH=40 /DNA_ID= /DNA_START= /DNA_END= /DNA_ORIENTATION=